MKNKTQLLSALLAVLAIIAGCTSHPEADLILYNGKIQTMDSAMTVVEALAVKDGKIIATGTLDSIRRTFRAPRNIDLEGKFVYPGFNDAHAHFFGYAKNLRSVNLVGTASFIDVLGRVQAFSEKHRSAFIIGRGWDQNDWADQQFPTKEELDKLYPEIPVYLTRIDGHAALANQAALDYAHIDSTTQVEGGVIVRKNGKLTGLLIDNATDLVKLPEMPLDQKVVVLSEAEDLLFSHGLTSVTDAGLARNEIELLDSLTTADLLKLRINVMVSDDSAALDYYLNEGIIEKERLTVRTFKFYIDGALGSRGALMLQPYSDDTANTGLMLDSLGHFQQVAQRLADAGWQMAAHAIGDSANRIALDIYEEALAGKTDHRWRIEHAQVVHPADIIRFGVLGIIPSVQPNHATSDMYWAQDRLSESRMSRAYPYQSLLQSTGLLALGTDFPVEDIDPLKTFYAAVFRQDAKMFPEGGFTPGQKLSREQALRGMTEWAAYASFEEDRKGKLTKGMLADLVVLDKDLLVVPQEKLLATRVLMTFVGGELVFEAAKPE